MKGFVVGLITLGLVISVTAPAFSAPSSPMVISDFEDPHQEIITFAGPNSSVKTEFEKTIVHGGSQALKVTELCSDWAGALIKVDAKAGDWSEYTTLTLWIYGSNTGDSFNIDLEDKGLEQFRYTMTNNFTGWKKFSIPIASIAKRGDYQAPNAKQNGKIDWPLNTIQFFTSSHFHGTLIFDDITVQP